MNDAEQMRALFEAAFPGAIYRTAGGVGVRSEYFDAWVGFQDGYKAAKSARIPEPSPAGRCTADPKRSGQVNGKKD